MSHWRQEALPLTLVALKSTQASWIWFQDCVFWEALQRHISFYASFNNARPILSLLCVTGNTFEVESLITQGGLKLPM